SDGPDRIGFFPPRLTPPWEVSYWWAMWIDWHRNVAVTMDEMLCVDLQDEQANVNVFHDDSAYPESG
ncbi:hypothetical protein, partial [Candidatus Entotheonella palauensis]|uniref:hypothetical protein n=1 Tax=Candidatus Entotheonella palauensis TaxID=93172 RepID=UPI001C4DF7E1